MLPAVVDGKGRSNAAKKPSPVVTAHPGGEVGLVALGVGTFGVTSATPLANDPVQAA